MNNCQILGRILVLVGLGSLLVVPIQGKSRYPVPNKEQLKSRVDQLYKAEAREDWKTFYAMTSPEIRESTTLIEFLKEFEESRTFKIVSWKIKKIRGAEHVEEPLPPGVKGGAEVEMDVEANGLNGIPEDTDDQTDYWIYWDKEWYWVWRGWPYD